MANDMFQFTLAKMYLEGSDEDQALEGLETMKKLAENGNGEAAYEVGLVYGEGCLVPNDLDEARKWYQMAVALGHASAREKLAALGDEAPPPPPQNGDGPAFKCGKCGQIVPFTLHKRIDVTGNPELKEQVATGRFFNQVCPHCGAGGIIPYGCIYIDNDASLFVDVCTDREAALNDEDSKAPMDMGGWDEQWRIDGAQDVRIAVVGLNGLREAILVKDAGLNMYAVAACKKAMKDEFKYNANGHLYFMGLNKDSGALQYWFVDAASGEPQRVEMPRKAYDNLLHVMQGSDFEPLRLCELIDEESIEELMKRVCSTEPLTKEFYDLKMAAKGQDGAAWYALGAAYYEGVGVSQNYYKAFKCFREGADAKNADAQHALAICFVHGLGVTQSAFRAHAFMKASAEQGNLDAIDGMGMLAQQGIGCDVDVEEAISWFEKAASQGHSHANFNLARMYDTGDGVPVDQKKAYRFFAAAYAAGEERAKEGMDRLSQYKDDMPPPPPVEPPTPSVKPTGEVAPLTPRDLIKACADAFAVVARKRGLAPDDIEAREELDYAEDIIHFFENDPSLADEFDETDVDDMRKLIQHWSWRAGVVYGAKFRTEPKSINSEVMRRIIAEKGSFPFSHDIIATYLGLDEDASQAFNEELYASWQEIFKPCLGATNEVQLVSCLYYVAFHLGVTMMMDRRRVPEGSSFTYGEYEKLLEDAPSPGDAAPPVPPQDSYDDSTDGPHDDPVPPSANGDGPVVECPKCHQQFSPKIQDAFDLDAHPELLKKLQDGSAFAQTCPHCHGISKFPVPVTVFHIGKRYVIRLTFDRDEARAMSRAKLNLLEGDLVGKVRQRIVCGFNSFIEKLTILNQGLNDNIIEVMKLMFLRETNDENIVNMLFAGIKNGKFMFAVFLKGQPDPKFAGIPGEVYDKMSEEFKDAFPEDCLRYVSHVTVGKILDGGSDDDKIDPNKILDVFAKCGCQLGLLERRSFNLKNVWRNAAIEIASKLLQAVEGDAELAGDYREMRNLAVYGALHIGLGASVEWVANGAGFKADTVYDMMMLEGGFCRVGEIPFEKLASFSNDDFHEAFEKYASTLEKISAEIAVKAGRDIDPNAEKPSEQLLGQYKELVHKECFAAFLCGLNAGLLLQHEGAQLEVSGGVSVQLDYGRYLNLALAQNKCPLITSIKIKNLTEEKKDGLVCRLSSPDDFFQSVDVEVGPLWPGAESELGSVKLNYNVGLLRKLEDQQPGLFRIEILSGEETLFAHDYDITALSADQSHSIFQMPMFLASFVRPNSEAVKQLMSDVAKEMREITKGDASLAGYQGDQDHVFKMCAAMYRAIQKKGIAYSNPPESFDLPGQKIRMPDTVMKYKLATCLDSTILFASVMEACMLHPVVILISGHAFVGCLLSEMNLPQVEMRDPQVLRKLIASGDFVAIETTMVTGDDTFEKSEEFAREVRLAAANDANFVCAIDVAASRMSGVKPLALGGVAEGSEFVAEGHDVSQKGVGQLREVKSVDLSKLKKATAPTGRIAVWAQKLLDLSPMNKLLNAKDSKDVLRLSCPNPAVLEDWLASGDEVPIRSVVEAFTAKDAADVKAHKLTTERVQQIIEAEFACKRLIVEDGPRKVQTALRNLYRLGRTDLEETGAHTLFVAIGFLRWKDPKKRTNAKAYEAPLILVPIRIGKTATDSGICISKRDDETVINTTLLQFLRAQYGIEVPGLEPLPQDDAGLDVPHIMQIFRECIKKAKDVEVVNQAAVGHFSFGKFAMWRDLMENSEALKQSQLVNHLISAGGKFSDGIEVFDPSDIAKHLKPGELYCPVSADSSQLTAVLYSELGKSFVLYGPPGTGKSQTITNMIAHNLAIGRRVLFVSEKKAALDVVHKRLREVGLEPFCLELHSNKGDKSSVMQQFVSSLEVSKTVTSADWKKAADEICSLRDELAGYVDALHTRYPNRLTAYDCFARAFEKGDPKYVELITADCLTQTWEELEEQKNALRTLITEIQNVPDRSALQRIPRLKDDSWSVPYEKGLKTAADNLAAAAKELSESYCAVAQQFSLALDADDEAVARAVELLKVFKAENKALSRIEGDGVTPERLKELMEEAEARQKRKSEALSKREAAEEALIGWDVDKLLLIDVQSVRNRAQDVNSSGFLTKHFKENSFLKEFAELKKSLGRLTMPDLLGALSKIETLKKVRKEVAKVLEELSAQTDDVSPEENTSSLSEELVTKIDRALSAWESYSSAKTAMLEYVEKGACGDSPAMAEKTSADLSANISKVRYVMRYRPFRNTADMLGVSAFADMFESGELAAGELLRVFEDAYLGKMLLQVEEASPILPGFFGHSHESKIEQFHRLIDRYSDLSQQAIFAKIAARYPDFEGNNFTKEENRQLGVLKREINKKRGQTTVRKLLEDIGDLVSKYKPCFLMSPLSVAQFLDVEIDPFDLIIFDEASQIEVCDAIGVMARGKQVIVVGDPQQMPPTNFFGGSVMGGLEKEVEDAESILVECLDVGLPKTYLNWHYRSRHESLIAFSNHNYYEDELNSFPSVSESPRLGVRFHYVTNGVYGHSTNPNEAQAIVDYVCKRVKSEVYKKHPRSVGIVTFNMQQQTLIEDMIDQRCAEDPELKVALSGGDMEGDNAEANKSEEKMFFVRNLENVQGDEADVIIFSITFGPDADGRISMNFGPLNREGGERRLNVAVTRAREQMVVFSSMRYTNIRNDEDLALGARGLRGFLEYAETGSRSSSCKAAVRDDSGFSKIVANFIEDHGYKVVRNVGYSGYKIDMAVLNPYDDKEYILGVECDGPSYAKQRTVRDRDVLRRSVLARGGWKMCRVWCAEWYHDRAGAEARLLKLLESIKPEKPVEEAPDDDTPVEITVIPRNQPEKTEEELVELPPAPETPPPPPSPEEPKPPVPPVPPAEDLPPAPAPIEPPAPPAPPSPPPEPPPSPADTPVPVVPPAPVEPEPDFPYGPGEVARKVLFQLFLDSQISDDELQYLLSDQGSSYFRVGSKMRVLKESFGDPKECEDEKGAGRYYKKFVISVGDKKYWMCSQWFPYTLQPLLAWLHNKGLSDDRIRAICEGPEPWKRGVPPVGPVPRPPVVPPVPPVEPPAPPTPPTPPPVPPIAPVVPTPPAEPAAPTVVPTPPAEPVAPTVVQPPSAPKPTSGGLPLTETALMAVRAPIALQIDGEDVRIVSSWKDCYLALCEKLMELDTAKFDTLPTQPQFKRFFIKAIPRKKYPDCYMTKFGTEQDIRAKEIGSKSYFYMPTYVVHSLLKYFGIDASRVTIRV